METPPSSPPQNRNDGFDLWNEQAFRQALRRSAFWPAALLGGVACILALLTFYLLHASRGGRETSDAMFETMRLEKLFSDLETGLRGFQITGDQQYLEPFTAARSEIPSHFENLKKLTGQRHPPTAALDLEQRGAKWNAFADETLRRSAPGDDARAIAYNRQGKTLMDEFRKEAAHIIEVQQRALTHVRTRISTLRIAIFVGLAFMAVGVAPFAAFWLQRLLFRLDGAYRESLAAVTRASEQLRVTLRSIGDAVLATDAQGVITFLNPVAEKLTGWTNAEARGRKLGDIFQIFHEETGAPAEDPVAKVLRERLVIGLANHTVLRPREGADIPIEDSAAPILGDGGELHGVILVFHDVSATREAQKESQVNAERFRFLAESMPQKIFTATSAGDFDYVNQQWLEFAGVEYNQIIGGGWKQLLHPDDAAETQRKWSLALETGEPFYGEHRFRRADGVYRWHVTRVRAMRQENHHMLLWIGSITDIEDIRRAREEAERANRAKDNFLATLSHELRTPLTPVLIAATSLRDDETVSPELRQQLGMIQHNIELEARLIDDLLDLTRISRGRLLLRRQPCDIHTLIGFTLDIVREEATTKRITLDVQLEADLPTLSGDPSRLQQVFWNILKNAVKFTEPEGRVTIRTFNQEERVVCEVTDTGIGFAPGASDRIFRPFEQADLANNHRYGGLGLGLAIAKSVVTAHGGQITAESEGLGKGATLRVELPAAEVQLMTPEAEAPRDALRPQPSAPVHRLLLVEDHRPTAEVLKRLLKRVGYSVTAVASVAEGLSSAREQKFDFVLSDLGLPDGAGSDLMRALRDEHGLRGIALSGYGMEEDVQRSADAGFVAHITKPVDFMHLRRMLELHAPVAHEG